MKTDAELIRATLDGDGDAFWALMDRHRLKVLKVINKKSNEDSLAARKDCADAGISEWGIQQDDKEDAFQETLIRARDRLHTYTGFNKKGEPVKFSTWLCGMAKNIVKEVIRRRERFEPVIIEGYDEDGEEMEFEHPKLMEKARLTDTDLILEAEETLEDLIEQAPRDQWSTVSNEYPAWAGVVYLATLAWPDNGKRQFDCVAALMSLLWRKWKAEGRNVIGTALMPAQKENGAVRMLCKRLNRRIEAGRNAQAVWAGASPNEIANQSGKRTAWHRDVWRESLPVLPLAMALVPILDRKFGPGAQIDARVITDLTLDRQWAIEAMRVAGGLTNLLRTTSAYGVPMPHIDLPPQLRVGVT